MSKIWQTIRGYIWWTHPRGNMHYDVMVTLILAFIFFMPPRVFNDKPTERVPHQSEVLVVPDGDNLIYEIDASAVQSKTDTSIREDLLRVIEPIAGEAEVTRYEAVADSHGKVKVFKVWVKKPYR
jgi:hypothetical protein